MKDLKKKMQPLNQKCWEDTRLIMQLQNSATYV